MNINTYRVGPHSWSTIVSNFGNIELSHYLLRRKWARGNFWEGSQTQRHDMVTSCATGGSPIGVGGAKPTANDSRELWPLTNHIQALLLVRKSLLTFRHPVSSQRLRAPMFCESGFPPPWNLWLDLTLQTWHWVFTAETGYNKIADWHEHGTDASDNFIEWVGQFAFMKDVWRCAFH